ncbi:MAG: sodium/proline symporter, partial [Gammaproteobacteria bacterium]|nr:sodium/proline symporter [Gammaproteobacteria bacterium]
ARGIALTWFTIVLGGMFILGVSARILLGSTLGDSEQVFFEMADRLLPTVLTGVLIAAVLSAIMSTADSQLLVAGSAIHHDLAGGIADTRRSAATSARVAVVGVALAATALAIFLPESIFSRVLFAWNALGAAFGPIVIARLQGWRVADWSVPTALCLGFGLTVVFYSLPNGPGDIWERFVPFVVGIVTLLLGRTSSR